MKKQTWKIIESIITWTLLIILLITIIHAKINGMYIDKQYEVIETCNGKPTTNTTLLQPVRLIDTFQNETIPDLIEYTR